ncbi:MAG: GNAT family N-acetyltransferase [Candidatus Eisenbacteria bacterium]
MPLIRPFRDDDASRWDAYVAARPESHFGQRSGWKSLTEASFPVRSRYTLAERDGVIRGVLPLFEKRGHSLFSAPGGLLADDDATAEALLAGPRDQVRREGLRWLELRDQRVAWPGLETSTEHVTLELTLEPSAEAQWQAFDAKLRNQVRKGEKSAFTLRSGARHLRDFHRVLLENLRDLGTPVRGPDYFRHALAVLGDDADLLILELEGRPVGAMFTVAHGARMTDPWASSLRRVLARCPNHVLYWAAIRRAIERGLGKFDFGRSQRTSGTFSFKTQWGAEPVQLYYQYALGPGTSAMPTLEAQKGSFALGVKVWRHLPLPLAALLGERVRRRFPEVL